MLWQELNEYLLARVVHFWPKFESLIVVFTIYFLQAKSCEFVKTFIFSNEQWHLTK
jgi:hypothetical protein